MRRAIAVVAIFILSLAAFVIVARVTSKTVDGIPCDVGEQVSYHVHAHLTIVAGPHHLVYPPANVGIHWEHLCLYWLHTHDDSGMIHIEASHPIAPTLGQFFDIWGQPLNRRQVAGYTRTGPALRVYVDTHLHGGNPRNIKLFNHTWVTIELGPPYIAPPQPSFAGY